jgi:uncharacterized protein YegP (UPF0339 family)
VERVTNTGELFHDSEGLWRFRIKAANGEIITQSEAYSRRVDAVKTLENLGVAPEDVSEVDE